jgi:RimJ/RimL family protein N-acetyltransferase
VEPIHTSRLTLRAFRADDLDAVAELLADPEVMRYVGAGEARGRTREEADTTLRKLLDEYDRWGHGLWAVTAAEEYGGKPIGWSGLLRWELDEQTEVEVAYLLGRPYWGRGYATEAATAARDHAVRVLGRRRLVSLIYPQNTASIRVAEKLGMAHEREAEFFRQRLLLYSLTAPAAAVEEALGSGEVSSR